MSAVDVAPFSASPSQIERSLYAKFQPPWSKRRLKTFVGRFFLIEDSARSYIRAAQIRGQNGGVDFFQKSFLFFSRLFDREADF